jgi:hypothetical protein
VVDLLVWAHGAKFPLLLIFLGLTGWSIFRVIEAHRKRGRVSYESNDWIVAHDERRKGMRALVGSGVVLALTIGIPAPNYDVREVIRYTDKVRVETRTERHPYKELYDACVGSSRIEKLPDERLRLCHTQAMQASGEQPVRVRVPHPYKELFEMCNDRNQITPESNPGRALAEIRNARLEICHRAALEGSQAR